jgi:integrase
MKTKTVSDQFGANGGKGKGTGVEHLWCHPESKIYYARKRIGGSLRWRSLRTTSKTTAKLLLRDELDKMEDRFGTPEDPGIDVKMTFGAAFALSKGAILRNPRLADSTKEVRLRTEKVLLRHWPDIFDRELRDISSKELADFQERFENGLSTYLPTNAKSKRIAGNSPTTINAFVTFMRSVFAEGVKLKVIRANPAEVLKRKEPSRKIMDLPNKQQWVQMIEHIRGTKGWGRKAGDLIEGLAYTGMRVGESRSLLWTHVDFVGGSISVYPEKSDYRQVPMIDEARRLFERMRAEREPAPNPSDRVFQCGSAANTLQNGCAFVGKRKMTHHDLRHLFATRVLESGVDIPTLAKWLGHKDGGILAMKTYINVGTEHTRAAAKKVSFR